jgi:hypothetical protein
VSFRTQGRVDVEPPSVTESMREFATSSPRAWQAAVDADVVDDVEDKVVEIFFLRVVRVARRVVKIFSPICSCSFNDTIIFTLENMYVYAAWWLLDGCPFFFLHGGMIC